MIEELQNSMNSISQTFSKAGSIQSLGDIFGVIINILLGVTFGVSIIGIAYSFFQFVMSRGDKDAVAKAKVSITWSVVALVIALLVVAFRGILYKLLGFDTTYDEVNPQF